MIVRSQRKVLPFKEFTNYSKNVSKEMVKSKKIKLFFAQKPDGQFFFLKFFEFFFLYWLFRIPKEEKNIS